MDNNGVNGTNGHAKVNPYRVSVRSNDPPPPHSLESEEAVLGSILIDPEAILQVDEFLQPEHFYLVRNAWVYVAMVELARAAQPIDLLAVAERLKRNGKLEEIGGEARLIDLLNSVPTSVNVHHYGQLVKTAAMRRRMINTAGQLARLANDQTGELDGQLEQVENLVYGLRGEHTRRGLQPPKQHARLFLDGLERQHERGREMMGLPTGFLDLDRMLGGIIPEQFYCLAGRPGMGKSSLLLAICDDLARVHKKQVAFFSLEMNTEQIDRRIVSRHTRIDLMRLRNGDIREQEWSDIHQIVGQISEGGLHIDDTPAITPSQVRAKARRMRSEHGLDLIVIDHLHLMQPDRNGRDRIADMGDIARSVAFLGKELGVPVLAAAQLSRAVENRSDKRPLMSDLRESGAIEESAFCIMLMYRDEYYNPDTSERPNIAEIDIAKHRDGPTGTIDLYWHAQLATFHNLRRNEIAF